MDIFTRPLKTENTDVYFLRLNEAGNQTQDYDFRVVVTTPTVCYHIADISLRYNGDELEYQIGVKKDSYHEPMFAFSREESFYDTTRRIMRALYEAEMFKHTPAEAHLREKIENSIFYQTLDITPSSYRVDVRHTMLVKEQKYQKEISALKSELAETRQMLVKEQRRAEAWDDAICNLCECREGLEKVEIGWICPVCRGEAYCDQY